MKNNNKILVVGDMHLKQSLNYSELIKDGRKKEKQDILDFIIEQSKDVSKVVFLGDMFNCKINPSSVIKEAVEFLERFENKKLFILLGNHEIINSSESSAISFLKSIKGKNWHIIEQIEKIGDYVFAPYLSKIYLGAEDNQDGAKKAMEALPNGRILFCHNALSNTKVNSQSTDFFNEIVFPKSELDKKFEKVVAGHIHKESFSGKFLVASSIFTSEVGEEQKYVYKIDEDTLEIETIPLPGRKIIKLENPKVEDFENKPTDSIYKIIITDEKLKPEIEKLETVLSLCTSENGAYIILEQIPKKRERLHYNKEKKILDLSIVELLEEYAKEKGIEYNKLLKGFELIKL